MKLRLILLILSLMAFVSVTVGGYLYYSSLRDAAFNEAEQQTIIRLERINKNLSILLTEYNKPVRTLAGMQEILTMLTNSNADSC